MPSLVGSEMCIRDRFTPVSGLFFKYVAGAVMFLYVETVFNVCASVVFGEHMC